MLIDCLLVHTTAALRYESLSNVLVLTGRLRWQQSVLAFFQFRRVFFSVW